LDYFSWILTNLLAGFVLWSLVFTALKSNKFTEKLAESVDTYTKKTIETIPFLPGEQSVASLQQTWSTISTNLPDQFVQSQTVELEKLFKKKKNNNDNENNNQNN
jgi:hypothetical protein